MARATNRVSDWYVVARTHASAKPAACYEYDAWGDVITEGEKSGVENPHRYSTKEWDEKSGLYYFGARYYCPEIGRWTQRDRIGPSQGPGLYLFVGNSPANPIDPWGEEKGVPGTFDILIGLNPSGELGTLDVGIYYRPPSDACCGRIILRQIARMYRRSGFPVAHVPRTSDSKPWHPDWPNPPSLMKPFVRGAPWPRGQEAEMGDSPGWDTPDPLRTRSYLKQEFETCAICFDVNSDDYKKVYGCLSWSFEVKGHHDIMILQPSRTGEDLEARNLPGAPASENFKRVFPDLRY